MALKSLLIKIQYNSAYFEYLNWIEVIFIILLLTVSWLSFFCKFSLESNLKSSFLVQ